MRSGPAGGEGGFRVQNPSTQSLIKRSAYQVKSRFYSNNINKSRFPLFLVRIFPACRTLMLPEYERKSDERMEAADGAERDLGMLTHPPGFTFF